MEDSVFGDKLVDHGKLYKGRNYIEHRRFSSKGCKISFYFITRVYSDYIEKVLKSFQNNSPDVLILNSCLWDICRWGPKGVEAFKKNLRTLMCKFDQVLSKNCIVIWVTTPPVSQEMKGGFLIDQLEFLAYSLRFHILEANSYARRIVVSHGYDVVDAHYHLQMQLTKRAEDGIHWVPLAVRHITNLILTHISLAWGVPLPHRIDTVAQHRELSDLEIQNDEAGGSNRPNLEQNAPPEVHALKDIENTQGSSAKKRPKKKRKQAYNNGFDETYHGFEQRNRQRQAQQKIREWRREPYPSRPESYPSRPWLLSHSPSDRSPYYSPYDPPPVQPYSFEAHYRRYSGNSPAAYPFPNPGSTQPSFDWTMMRQIQFGRGPSHWHPR